MNLPTNQRPLRFGVVSDDLLFRDGPKELYYMPESTVSATSKYLRSLSPNYESK